MESQNPFQHLNYLGFHLIEPSSALRAYVQHYWLIHQPATMNETREEFWHSGAGSGIVFNLAGNFSIDGQAVPRLYFVDGAYTTSRRLSFSGEVYAIGIRFHPAGAFPFLDISAHELSNGIAGLDEINMASAHLLYEQLLSAPSIQQKITLIEAWLLCLLNARRTPPPIIAQSLNLLKQYRGQIQIHELAQAVAISERQLQRLYQEQVGISPKQYARLQRVEHARKSLKIAHDPFADIGISVGYYDQSHFIREFKSVVGMTPEQYQLRHQRRVGDSSKA